MEPIRVRASGGPLERCIANLRGVWRGRRRALHPPDRAPLDPDLSADDTAAIRRQIQECLEARGGEVSARTRTANLAGTYLGLSPAGRKKFQQILARDFAVDRTRLSEAVRQYHDALDGVRFFEVRNRLREILIAPRARLLAQFSILPDGVKFLVDMRKDLLAHAEGDWLLSDLDTDLRHLLAAWFDIGFLELRRIAWDSPASLLEKLAAYEAVHQIRSWADLKNRLDADRRCYGFFHARMPNEPLIFVEVALVKGMVGSVQILLDEHAPTLDPQEADTAIFYSISSTQAGLRGISFGSFLIKKVVDDLAREFPKLTTFATLSPIPGFMSWLEQLERHELEELVGKNGDALRRLCRQQGVPGDFRELLAGSRWRETPTFTAALRHPLTRLCAHYLLVVKRQGRPIDPVARFHLRNGAGIERVNWLGDTSGKGLQQSAGLTVNYYYRVEEIEANHERYASCGAIAASAAVRRLINQGAGPTDGAPAKESLLHRALSFVKRKEPHGGLP